VGVVGDVEHDGLRDGGRASRLRPVYQVGIRAVNFVLRTFAPRGEPRAFIRREIPERRRDAPIFKVQTMDDVYERLPRAAAPLGQMIGAFAILSLLLASIGRIYGLLAYRRPEIPARIA